MIQLPKLCGQRWKLSVGEKIQSRGDKKSSEHLLLLPDGHGQRAWYSMMEYHGSVVGFIAPDKELQTPHRHTHRLPTPKFISCLQNQEMAPHAFLTGEFSLKHYPYFPFQEQDPSTATPTLARGAALRRRK